MGPGVVINKRTEPRSYEIATQNGSILRRNPRHLKETGKEQEKTIEFEEVGDDINTPTQPQKQTTITTQEPTPKTTLPIEHIYHTRSGRASVKPTRLDL